MRQGTNYKSWSSLGSEEEKKEAESTEANLERQHGPRRSVQSW